MHDITTEDDIRTLVDSFYSEALRDPLLGPIFMDVAKLDVEKHLPLMYSFWSTMLLGAGTYRRQTLLAHLKLQEHLAPAHFARWLELFERTLDTHFIGPTAEMARQRARNIAAVMQARMGIGSQI